MNVLIADDDRIARMRLAAYVREWGHTPLPAEDGASALKVFRDNPCNLVVTDWQMPGLDGLELVRRLRGMTDDRGYVYVILLTSRTEKSDIVRGLETGADDFVCKPFDRDELRVRLRAGERIVRLEHALAGRNRELEAANERISGANRRMTADLRAAARVQTAFLPPEDPKLPGARIAWHFGPCDELAGDTFTVRPLQSGALALCVADVCGHGVASALLSVVLTRLLSHLPETADGNGAGSEIAERPEEVARHLNEWFLRDAKELEYFTLLYGVRDPRNGTFRYVSAGHPGPIHVPAGGLPRALPSHAPAVGLFADAEFVRETVPVQPGDRLYFYTDGIPETADPDDEPFGHDRLMDEVARIRAAPLRESVDTLAGTVEGWRQGARREDDLTILAVEFERV